jgi:hypothetical protein
MIRAVWILQDIGPCLYRYALEKRFWEPDENLFSGFFAALETFAKSIGSEEVLKVELSDLILWFRKGTNVIHVVASDRNDDMSEILLKISQAFSEVCQNLRAFTYNPLIPSNVAELRQRIDSEVKGILFKPRSIATQVQTAPEQPAIGAKDAASVLPENPLTADEPTITMEIIHKTKEETKSQMRHKALQKQSKVNGDMIPKLEKPLTETLREREKLVKRFGVASVDVLQFANGMLTVNEIAMKSHSERTLVEDVLNFAETLGIVEFKQKK